MKNPWQVRVVLVTCVMLSGCVTTTSNTRYIPDYDEDYIYNVTYYGYRPMSWGDGYYNGYGYETRDWNDSKGSVATSQPVKTKAPKARR